MLGRDKRKAESLMQSSILLSTSSKMSVSFTQDHLGWVICIEDHRRSVSWMEWLFLDGVTSLLRHELFIAIVVWKREVPENTRSRSAYENRSPYVIYWQDLHLPRGLSRRVICCRTSLENYSGACLNNVNITYQGTHL